MAAHIALAGSRVTASIYALSLHASTFTVGILMALFAIVPMIFAVPMGRLVDRIGIHQPMLFGCILMSIGCIAPSLVSGINVVYVATMFIGTGFMMTQVGTQHAVGSMSEPVVRSANFGWLSLCYSVSSFSGPVIAGLVIDLKSFQFAFALFGGFCLLALSIITLLNNAEQAPTEQKDAVHGSTIELLSHPDMRGIYIIGILLSSAWDLFTFVIPVHGTSLGFSASKIGLILGCFSVGTFTIRLLMPWITRQFSAWAILAGALSVAVVAYLLLPFMHHPISFMIIAGTLGLALGSGQPNILTLMHKNAPVGRVGEAAGVRLTIINACQVFFPLAFGAAGATVGLFPVCWTVGAMICTGLPFALRKAFPK